MGLYVYRAIDDEGTVHQGRMPAVSSRELESRLLGSGLELLSARQSHTFSAFRFKVTARDKIAFCLHMETTLKAGLMVTDALQDQVEGADNGHFKDAISAIAQAVREGTSLSTAMASFPGMFDETFIGMVRSGEESGRLGETFEKLGKNIRWQEDLASQLKKLLLYPAFTITVLLGVTAFMLLYLVPQLADFIISMSGGELPLQTRMLLGFSEFLQQYWWAVLLAPVLLVIGGLILLRLGGHAAHTKLDALKLRIPVLGGIIQKILLSRFCAMLAMLYESGLPVIQSIGTARDAVGNRSLAQSIDRVIDEVEAGKGLTDAFSSVSLFPNLMIRMIRIGETSGEIDKGLRNVTDFYNRDIDEDIGRIQAMIEPALTLVLGAILAWLMMAVLGPIYDLLAKIGT